MKKTKKMFGEMENPKMPAAPKKMAKSKVKKAPKPKVLKAPKAIKGY
jgi:hypothetical protein